MIRPVRIYGNPVLEKKSGKVKKIDVDIRRLAADMMETMYHYRGVGLAGPQVGESLRIIAMDPRDPREACGSRVLINPKITSRSGEAVAEEGCLSLPNIFGDVRRAQIISIT